MFFFCFGHNGMELSINRTCGLVAIENNDMDGSYRMCPTRCGPTLEKICVYTQLELFIFLGWVEGGNHWIPSGKLSYNYGHIHHFNGQINTFYGHFP